MKKILFFLVVAVAVASCGSQRSGCQKPKGPTRAKAWSVKDSVQKSHRCGGIFLRGVCA